MKIVINDCFGGFGLSDQAFRRYAELKGGLHITEIPPYPVYTDPGFTKPLYDFQIQRDDPALVQTVEEMGEEASSRLAKLKVVEIPDGIEWELDDYDGMESIHEQHRSWR